MLQSRGECLCLEITPTDSSGWETPNHKINHHVLKVGHHDLTHLSIVMSQVIIILVSNSLSVIF